MAAISKIIRRARGFFEMISGWIMDGQTADPTAIASAAVVFYRSDLKKLRFQDDAGAFHNLAATDEVIDPLPVPVVLSKHTNGSIAARFTPGFAGKITKISASVTDPATTAAKLATFTAAIGGVSTTGGALALTSANCTPVGAKVDGSAITAANVFGAADEITIVASGVTAFVEGQVVAYLFLAPLN